MISSFRTRLLDSVFLASPNTQPREFIVHSLLSKIGQQASLEYTAPEQMTGINIVYEDLTEESVKKFQSENKLIGVWFVKKSQPES